MTTKINSMSMTSLRGAQNLIRAAGPKKIYKLLGQPGIGKTSVIRALAKELGMPLVYIYAPDKRDLSDFGAWIPDMQATPPVLRFVLNPKYAALAEGPCIIFIDEKDKANNLVVTLLTPVLDPNPEERMLGDLKIHPDSIVVEASNFSTDGVGDRQLAHAVNRVCPLFLSNPTGEAWRTDYAIEAGIHPSILAITKIMGDLFFECYINNPESTSNPYNFNPRRPKGMNHAFVSPRSLAAASVQVYQYERGEITYPQMMAALRGDLGDAGAIEVGNYVDIYKEVPDATDIVHGPTAAPVPPHAIAQTMIVLNAVQWLGHVANRKAAFKNDDGTPMAGSAVVAAWVKYLERLVPDVVRLFVDECKRSKNERLVDMLTSTGEYARLCGKLAHVL